MIGVEFVEMKGRLENTLKIEKEIQVILEDMPECVSSFYYWYRNGTEASSCADFLRKIKAFLNFVNKSVENIKKTDVECYLKHKETKYNSKGELVETTLQYRKNIYTALNTFFEYCLDDGYLTENPCKGIKLPKRIEKPKRKPELTSDDILNIIHRIEEGVGSHKACMRQAEYKERDKAIVLLFALTGMRLGALSEINVDDIDFKKNLITIIDKRHTTHEYQLNRILKKNILNWLEQRDKILNGESCEALFISNRRQRMSKKAIETMIGKFGLNKLTPHCLRAAFCTILYNETHDIEFVRRAVGHSSVNTTMRYIITDNAKEKTASIMNNLYKNAK